jgi:integrase/recombinase XerD
MLLPGAHVYCRGKGRKDRATPLTTQTVAVLRSWLTERSGQGTDPLFPTRRGGPLSRDAVERLLAKHTTTAAKHCPTLKAKRVSPHVLRHSTAMALLHAGVDITVIALWLGHESPTSTRAYLNPRKLHQAGEKSQVACSVRLRNGVVRSTRHAVWPEWLAR